MPENPQPQPEHPDTLAPERDSPTSAHPAEPPPPPSDPKQPDPNHPDPGQPDPSHRDSDPAQHDASKPEHPDPSNPDPAQPPPPARVSPAGWLAFALVALLAATAATLAIARAVINPRTDDAEIFANFIGMAPLVEGPITALPIRDNQFVHAGDLLYVIDERPYRYALERALSSQAALEGQIEDRQRSINAQVSNVHVQQANIESSRSSREAAAADIAEAQANRNDASAALRRAEADQRYAADNLHRLEPLLVQQFVTADQVDQARTLLETRTRAVEQAQAQLGLAEARIQSQQSRFDQTSAEVEQRRAQREQASNGIEVLSPLTNQREDRAAAVRLARYNLDNCRVYAPFNGYITNLTTSLGAYVHTGTQVFTMIDAREWWAIANFRETQLKHVIPGSAADVFLMQHAAVPLRGTVESVGFGVTPDPSVAGALTPGLPAIQRTLDWVHLAARYPVRIRILNPPPHLLRIGQTAIAVVHPIPSSTPDPPAPPGGP